MSALTLERMRTDVAEVLEEQADAFADEDNLVDFGLDSIRLMVLAERWSAAGAQVTFADLAERPALGEWWTLVQQRQSTAG